MLDVPRKNPRSSADTKAALAQMMKFYGDREWRLDHLYYVQNETGTRVLYKRREAQRAYCEASWILDILTKARQLGFSTEIAIEIADFCVFNKDKSAGIIDFKLEDAKKKLAKIKFAYDNLPEFLKQRVPLTKDNEDELRWANGSSCVVGTSHRGGTLQFLHISEFGKTAAEKPEVARQIITGALNTIAPGQIIKIESTAHGTSGVFYDMVERAKAKLQSGAPLSVLDYKLHFYGWMFNPAYRVQSSLVIITQEVREYFAELKHKYGIEVDGDQMAWYQQKQTLLGWDDMKEEFPSCIAGDVLVATPDGLIPMKDIQPDGKYVLAKFDQGEKEVFKVTTALGYVVKSTMDHPFLCEDGEFRDLKDIGVGDVVVLQKGGEFGSEIQTVKYHPTPFVDASIAITEKMALFLGIYMGDGSFYDGQLSVSCDAQDSDLVDIVTDLMREVSGGEPYVRYVGRTKGCADIRISRTALIEPFRAMKVIRQNGGGKAEFKRNICVPDFIRTSPKHIAAAFLRGLFEADGFAHREGGSVKFFGKDGNFVRDIQLLLLQFGITSKLTFDKKVLPNGKVHGGYSLSIRQAEAMMFAHQIGFISARKKARLAKAFLPKSGMGRKRIELAYTDKIASIEFVGVEAVYDITTATHQFSAGGIIVHNCLDECFYNSMQGTFFKKELSRARGDKRIGFPVPYDPTRRVHTCWDKGMNEKSDRNAIWWFQHDGVRFRWIDFHEGAGENIAYYARIVEEKRLARQFIYGTHYGPHDLKNRDWGSTSPSPKTMQDIAKDVGINFTIVDRVDDKEISIEAARRAINTSYFCSEYTARGVECLDNYRKTWNKVISDWTTVPFHNWASNGADAIQCGAMGVKPDKPEREGRRERLGQRKGTHWSQ